MRALGTRILAAVVVIIALLLIIVPPIAVAQTEIIRGAKVWAFCLDNPEGLRLQREMMRHKMAGHRDFYIETMADPKTPCYDARFLGLPELVVKLVEQVDTETGPGVCFALWRAKELYGSGTMLVWLPCEEPVGEAA